MLGDGNEILRFAAPPAVIVKTDPDNRVLLAFRTTGNSLSAAARTRSACVAFGRAGIRQPELRPDAVFLDERSEFVMPTPEGEEFDVA